MRVGLIGSGNISATHARAAEANGFDVVAVLGRTRDGAAALCDRAGGTPYDSLDAFLAHPGLELVAIGSPSSLHGVQAVAAVARGLHVLVEKPLDIIEGPCDALIDAADRMGVVVAVCFQDRFAPDIAAVKAAIDRGDLGRLLFANAEALWFRPPSYYASSAWRGTWEFDGGGALMNQGIHTADVLLWLCGDVAGVRSRVATLRHDIAVEDTAMALLDFANGARGSLTVTTAAYPGYQRRLVLAGTGGTVTIERDVLIAADFEHGLPAGLTVRPPLADDGRASSPTVSDISGHQALFADMAAAIRTGGRPRCDARDGRRSVALVRAVYASSASGLPVAPSVRDRQ